jgi:Tfp pilus assembly protein PilN
MSTDTLQVLETAAMPRVNLLPPEIAEQRRFRRMQLAMGSAVVVAVVAVAGGWVLAHGGVSSAQTELDSANATHTDLQQQVASYSNVKQVYADVAAHETMLTTAMSGEIQWSHYLNDLSLKIPDNVWLTNIAAQTSGASTVAPAASSTALTPNKIGTVTFTGVALTHDDVATWLESLASENGFANPYFSNSTEAKIGDQKVVNFSSTVDLTPDAHSGRYTKPAGG